MSFIVLVAKMIISYKRFWISIENRNSKKLKRMAVLFLVDSLQQLTFSIQNSIYNVHTLVLTPRQDSIFPDSQNVLGFI